MPGPGERIGDAYIRIHASGGDLGKDIGDGLKDLDGEFKKAGDRHGDIYERALTERVKRTEIAAVALKGQREARAVAREAKFTGNTWFGQLRKTILSSAKDSDIGAEMMRRIERAFIESGGDHVLIQRMIGTPAGRAKLFDQAKSEVERLRAQIANDAEDDAHRLNDKLIRLDKQMAEEALRIHRNFRDIELRDMVRQNDEAIRLNEVFNDRLRRGLRGNEEAFRRHNFTIKFTRDVDRLGDVIGRVFGKGSRSEFLNFFGRLAGNLTKLAFLPIKVINGFVDMARSFIFAGSAAGGSLTGFARIGATFTQMGITLPGVIAGFGALAIGLGALLFIIGPLIAGLSLLLGTVTALASSISFALVGAVAALVALLGPLVAGLGVVGLAFIGMSKEAKAAVKEAFQPLAAEFRKLGAVAREGLFSRLTETVGQLKGAFTGLRPLVREVSIAMADVGFSFAKAMNSPGFKRFRDEMFTFLPGAVRKLGDIFRQTLGGLGGLFVGMIPFMNDVLDGLVRITRQFSDWANSAKGQTSIENFFERVKTSMKSVGRFTREVIGLIGDLFSAGRQSGNTIFDDMTNAVAKFRKFIKSDPDILKDWFDSSVKFARGIGRLIVAGGKLADALDSPRNREIIVFFTDALSLTLDLIREITRLGNLTLGPLLGSIGQLRDSLNFGLGLGGGGGGGGGADVGGGGGGGGLLGAINGIISRAGSLNLFMTGLRPLTDAATQKVLQLARSFRDTGTEADKLGTKKPKPEPDPYSFSRIKDLIRFYKDAGFAVDGLNAKDILIQIAQESFASVDNLLSNMNRILNVGALIEGNTIDVRFSDGNTLDPIKQDALLLLTLGGDIDNLDPSLLATTNMPQVTAKGDDLLSMLTQVEDSDPKVTASDKGTIKPITKRAGDLKTAADKADGKYSLSFKSNASSVKSAVDNLISSLRIAIRLLPFVKRAQGGVMLPSMSLSSEGIEKMASGGYANGGGRVNFRQLYEVGEAGPELIVPLTRPLSMVDPTVRYLAAIAQGKINPNQGSIGVDASGWTIVTPASDASAVANKVLDRLTAAAY